MGYALGRLRRLACRGTETGQLNRLTEIGRVCGITKQFFFAKNPQTELSRTISTSRRHATRRHAARTVISLFSLRSSFLFLVFLMQAISSDLSILILPPFPGSPILAFLFIAFFLLHISDLKRSAHRLGGRDLD